MRKQIILYLGFVCLSLLAPTFAYAKNIEFSQEEQEFIRNARVLTVGFISNMPPMSFNDYNSEAQGVLIDYIKLVSKQTGLKFDIVQDSWTEIYSKVQNGQIDFLGMIKKTKDREKIFNFTRIYNETPIVIVSKKGKIFNALAELDSKVLAVNKDSYLHKYVVNNFPKVIIRAETGYLDAVRSVLNGDADAFICNVATVNNLVQNNMLSGLAYGREIEALKSSLSMAALKKNKILISILDKAIANIDSSRLLMIKNKWLKYNFENINIEIDLTAEEQKLIKYKPVLKVLVDAHFPPISFLDYDGQYKGIVVDYLEGIADKLSVKLEFFDPDIDRLDERYYIDILTTFSPSQYDFRDWLVTKPYVKFPYLLYSYWDDSPVLNIASIRNKTLAVIRNHDIAGVLNREYSNQIFYLAKDTADAIEALKTRKADYFISDILTIKHYLDVHRSAELTIVGKTDYFYNAELAVHADKRDLFNLLNKASALIDEKELNAIVDKWTQYQVKEEFDLSLLLKISTVIILLFLLVWYYSVHLRMIVNLRTQELLAANELLEQNKEHYKHLYEKADTIAEEKRRTEEQLYHAQKMDAIGKLAGGVAHDFNNILAVIFAQIHLIKLDVKKKRDFLKRVDELELAAARATKLVEQLLLFSRKQETDFKYLNLNELIENLLKMVSRLLGENISFRFLPGKLMGSTLADQGQLEQVVTNLCINARDAMPEGGTLTITSSSVDLRHVPKSELIELDPGRYNIFTVEDTGTGIEESLIHRIFEPFFTTKETGKGTGLGLATVYSIVKAHGGFINVESKIDKGSSFEIYLPVSEEQKMNIVDDEDDAIIHGGGQTILLAEDDANLRELAYEFLIEHGYKVIMSVDGEQAIEHYKHYRNSIDLLILDVVMPNKSGNEVYEYLQKIGADVPVIFCSGYAFDKLKKLNLDKDELLFIKKPYKICDLLNSVAQALKK